MNETTDQYLTLNNWQVRQIEKGIMAAEAGDFLSEEEVQAAIAK